jgi:hypothetical protein
LARFWSESVGQKSEKYLLRPVGLSLLFFGLAVTPFSNSQSGEFEPMKFAESLIRPVTIWDVDSLLQESYFRDRLIKKPISYRTEKSWPQADEINTLINQQDLILLTSDSNKADQLQLLAGFGHCGSIRVIQSFVDSMIYQLHPELNVRRRPTWLLHCKI